MSRSTSPPSCRDDRVRPLRRRESRRRAVRHPRRSGRERDLPRSTGRDLGRAHSTRSTWPVRVDRRHSARPPDSPRSSRRSCHLRRWTRRSFRCMAADALSGQAQLISGGDAMSALLASCAIPGVDPSIRGEDRWLCDGALADRSGIGRPLSSAPIGSTCCPAEPPAPGSGRRAQRQPPRCTRSRCSWSSESWPRWRPTKRWSTCGCRPGVRSTCRRRTSTTPVPEKSCRGRYPGLARRPAGPDLLASHITGLHAYP